MRFFLVNLLEIICSIPHAVKEELGDRHTCHEPLRPQDATVAFLFLEVKINRDKLFA